MRKVDQLLDDTARQRVETISNMAPCEFEERIRLAEEPILFKSHVASWPSVAQARKSDDALRDYLKSFDTGAELSCFYGSPELAGRVFYNDDFSGLNCARKTISLSGALDEILKNAHDQTGRLIYIGATPVEDALPGFEKDNAVSLGGVRAMENIWIGGPSRISAHYDFSDNLACVVAGDRRFILFPPGQLPNLYVGPLDFTPAGQPISLVDFHAPDFERHPRFRTALENALVADLSPGDALFIPSMWMHHVEAFSGLNVLVNFWHRRAPAFAGPPKDALDHAIMTLRDLPEDQKAPWRELFLYYVFENPKDLADHIPPRARGILNLITPDAAASLRASLRNRLNA